MIPLSAEWIAVYGWGNAILVGVMALWVLECVAFVIWDWFKGD